MSLPAAVFDPILESDEVQPHHTLAASNLEAMHKLSAEDNKAVVDKDILTLPYADSERILKVIHMTVCPTQPTPSSKTISKASHTFNQSHWFAAWQ